jgi:hypothetical protein
MNQDQFAGWKSLLAGGTAQFSADEPISGYFRSRRFKDGPLDPVAIWTDEDGLNVLFDNKPVALERVWPWAARSPVTYAAYQTRIETGKWPDIDPVVHEAAQARPGDNNPPTDPAELLAEQIAAAKAGAVNYAIISDDETLAKAQTLRSRLLELSGQADKLREEAKKPHLAAGKAVDEKWQPLVKLAKGIADGIRASMEKWETAKLAKRREEEAKAAEAQRAHDAAVAKAAAANRPAPPPPQITPMVPFSGPIKGAAGRAASSKPRMVVKCIMELDVLIAHYRLSAELSEFLMDLAQRDVTAGKSVPGVKVEEVARVV